MPSGEEPVNQKSDLQAEEAHLDLVTLIQKRIIEQSATVVNFLGSLYQRAPAEAAVIDTLVQEKPEDPEWQATLNLPDAILSQMDNLDALIRQLPSDPNSERSEEQDIDAIVALIQRNKELDTQLAAELRGAEATLHSGLCLASALGEHELRLGGNSRPSAGTESQKQGDAL